MFGYLQLFSSGVCKHTPLYRYRGRATEIANPDLFNLAALPLFLSGVRNTLTAMEFCPRKQHNLFVKLCCLRSFISNMPSNNNLPYIYEMLPDCTGITKKRRKSRTSL